MIRNIEILKRIKDTRLITRFYLYLHIIFIYILLNSINLT